MIDNNYFGIYRAVVVNNEDPEGLGRVTLQVPQIFGSNTTEWAWPVGGALSQIKYPYITVSTMTNQQVAGANTATTVVFTATEASNGGMELIDGTKVTVSHYWDYMLQFSAVFGKSTSTSANVDIWFRVNGVNLPRSNTRVVTTGNPNEVTVTVVSIIPLEPNDYVEVVFSSPNNEVTLKSFSGLSSPTRPDVPGIIFTANLVGKYKPKPGAGVWAMFEGGDPNFPLWIGEF